MAHEARSALVVIESFGDWPRFSIGFRPTTERTSPALVVWDWKSWTWWKEHRVRTIDAFVRSFLGGDDAEWLDLRAIDLDVAPSASTAFVPVVADPPPPIERFVVHPKFGRGRVVRELDGALEIAFEHHGVRKLLARFVEKA